MDFSELVLKFSNLVDALSGFLYTYILIFLLKPYKSLDFQQLVTPR